MQSLGELIDKLFTNNMKLWNTQDEVHQAYKDGAGLEAEVVQRLTTLNLERNRLMTEIDATHNAAVEAGKALVDPRIKIV